jgi:hypothetical protein
MRISAAVHPQAKVAARRCHKASAHGERGSYGNRLAVNQIVFGAFAL